jgi:hypothetical protein
MRLLQEMLLLVSGLGVLVATSAIFWALLPRHGKLHRWTNTEWEPYIAVALCAGVALGCTMTLSGVLDLLS